MRLLLDTHVLIWALNEPDRLPRRYEELLSDRAHEVFVGTVSSWEIVTKVTIGRLQFPLSGLATIIEETGFVTLLMEHRHVLALATLPLFHRDPFDCMLIAQARAEGLTLVTDDTMIRRYDVALL